jgi:hypothetical protein
MRSGNPFDELFLDGKITEQRYRSGGGTLPADQHGRRARTARLPAPNGTTALQPRGGARDYPPMPQTVLHVVEDASGAGASHVRAVEARCAALESRCAVLEADRNVLLRRLEELMERVEALEEPTIVLAMADEETPVHGAEDYLLVAPTMEEAIDMIRDDEEPDPNRDERRRLEEELAGEVGVSIPPPRKAAKTADSE